MVSCHKFGKDNMVAKRKKSKSIKEKRSKQLLPPLKKITTSELRDALKAKRILTAKRIIESKGASPAMKERARKTLEQL